MMSAKEFVEISMTYEGIFDETDCKIIDYDCDVFAIKEDGTKHLFGVALTGDDLIQKWSQNTS